MGKLQSVSQPHAPNGTVYWTTYAYDGLGRTTSVTLPDGSVTHYVYDDLAPGTDAAASYVRVTDPAGKQKRYQMDAFGHLTRVVEDPAGLAYATTYAYDVLDHLTQVQQTRGGATQTRTFNYNNSPYLQSATNPENGTVSYTYNSDGTLATKMDNTGVVTGYTYDSQKRLLTVGKMNLASMYLASGRPATQSSTYSWSPSPTASKAVDGNTDGNFADGSVSHTNNDANAWWQVDLGAPVAIRNVNIYNRTDCCGDRLSDYWVFISNTPFLSTDTPATLQYRAGTWSSHQTTAPSPMSIIAAGGFQGQYVRVQLSGTNYLALAEVQVMGGGDTTITPAYTYAYDSGGWGGTNQAGRLATISYRAAAGDQVVETYGYTAAGLPSGKDLWVTRSGSQAHKTLSYTYDNEGRRTSMTTPIRTFNHSYDAMERATGMTDTGGVTYVSGCRSPELNRDESAQCRGMLLTDSGAGQPNGARA
jgi:YD repeat-containing protein